MTKAALSADDLAMRDGVSKWIRYWSVTKNKKAAELAKAGGVSLAVQYRIESGETTPDVLYLIKVSSFLGLSMDALCGTAENAPMQSPHAHSVTQTATGAGIIQTGGDASRNRVSIRNKRNKNFLDQS